MAGKTPPINDANLTSNAFRSLSFFVLMSLGGLFTNLNTILCGEQGSVI